MNVCGSASVVISDEPRSLFLFPSAALPLDFLQFFDAFDAW
jgi:hypothetical protein